MTSLIAPGNMSSMPARKRRPLALIASNGLPPVAMAAARLGMKATRSSEISAEPANTASSSQSSVQAPTRPHIEMIPMISSTGKANAIIGQYLASKPFMQTPSALLVFTTLPNQDSARQLARQLVEARLAACVNVMSPCQSIYRWQGKLNEDGEIPVIIKTSVANYDRLEAFVRENHPYELPELVALNITHGLPGYLAWLTEETTEHT